MARICSNKNEEGDELSAREKHLADKAFAARRGRIYFVLIRARPVYFLSVHWGHSPAP
jgi:hypothetical protein